MCRWLLYAGHWWLYENTILAIWFLASPGSLLAITQSGGGRCLAAVLSGALLQAMHHTLTGQGLGDPAMQNPLASRQAILMGFSSPEFHT